MSLRMGVIYPYRVPVTRGPACYLEVVNSTQISPSNGPRVENAIAGGPFFERLSHDRFLESPGVRAGDNYGRRIHLVRHFRRPVSPVRTASFACVCQSLADFRQSPRFSDRIRLFRRCRLFARCTPRDRARILEQTICVEMTVQASPLDMRQCRAIWLNERVKLVQWRTAMTASCCGGAAKAEQTKVVAQKTTEVVVQQQSSKSGCCKDDSSAKSEKQGCGC